MEDFDKTKCPNCCFCIKSLRKDIEIRNEKIKELESENYMLNNELRLAKLRIEDLEKGE